MIARRDFLQGAMAAAALLGASGVGGWSRLAAQQRLGVGDLLGPDPAGNVTLIHVTDLHAQLCPIWYREPAVNLGVGAAQGRPPHLSGAAFRDMYGIARGAALDYALTADDFTALAKGYGRMGGLDRIATLIAMIRDTRPDALLLDGGDTWQGSYTALETDGQDMVDAMNLLGVDAMTGHWDFTLGIERVTEIIDRHLTFPFLGANIFDRDWDEPAFPPYAMFERGGALVAVIGQAFPYLPIANPGWMFPDLSFGLRLSRMAALVEEVRAKGAAAVVVLSHNGFDVDRQMARDVPGIDVILTGHSHDALPAPVLVGRTHLIASGSHGKFLSRVDLDVRDGAVQGVAHRLIPVFADVIPSDPDMADLIAAVRAPHLASMSEVIGQTEGLLYRRGTFNGTWDDLICQALLEQRDAEIALSPGFRWGTALLPGEDIRREDIFNATAMSYPTAYRTDMTGADLHAILEDVADNLFNPDPYYQQGGDMVRVGGIGYRINPGNPMGQRITEMTLLKSGTRIDPAHRYAVAGWASVAGQIDGPPIWDVLERHVRNQGSVNIAPNSSVHVDTRPL